MTNRFDAFLGVPPGLVIKAAARLDNDSAELLDVGIGSLDMGPGIFSPFAQKAKDTF